MQDLRGEAEDVADYEKGFLGSWGPGDVWGLLGGAQGREKKRMSLDGGCSRFGKVEKGKRRGGGRITCFHARDFGIGAFGFVPYCDDRREGTAGWGDFGHVYFSFKEVEYSA